MSESFPSQDTVNPEQLSAARARRQMARVGLNRASIERFLKQFIEDDLHAKTILSLSLGTLGVLHAACVCIHKDPDKVAERLEPIEREVVAPWIAEGRRDCFIQRKGNNLAILPNALNKAHAVAHVTARLRAEHGDILTFGMGDSRSDARFMAACDDAIVPRGTQLAGLALDAL